MTEPATIVSINRSSGGVPKLPVDRAAVTRLGMEGDEQRDRRFHGGPSRALSLYSAELIEQLQREGHPIAPGCAGENVTIRGLDWRDLTPGVLIQIGGVEIEITSYASPCKTIRHCFLDEESIRISQKMHPGWSRVYARVLTEGEIAVGDRAILTPR